MNVSKIKSLQQNDMGILNNIKDHFNTAEFTVSPSKKIKTICTDFKRAFGCSLCIYKGTHIADENLTINQLNEQVSAKIDVKSDKEIKIKASMKVGEAEKLFKTTYGLTVQVKNPEGTICVPNGITIGQAARGEYK